MEIVVLGSSSAGNSMLLRCDEGDLLIDAGFSLKEVRRRLADHGLALDRLQSVLITHEHSDHASGVGRFLHLEGVPVLSNRGTAAAVKATFGAAGVRGIEENEATRVGPFSVRPIRVPHDSADCCAYAIEAEGRRIVYATDLGSVPQALVEAGRGADLAVLESNHDAGMLWAGSYPKFLKERISGGRGHLSNEQAGEAVVKMAGGRLRKVLLAHLSEENNEPKKAEAAVRAALRAKGGLSAFDLAVEAAPRDGPTTVRFA